MKIIITGSLGHISKLLTQELIQKGHAVTVISSNREKQKDIEALGARAAIGSVEDINFVAAAFAGADAAYTMIPGADFFFDPTFDVYAYSQKVARNFKEAIQKNNIKRVIHLSSIGAHTNKNNGLLLFHFQAENILRELPSDFAIKFMRPVGFYNNMLGFIQTIKTHDIISTNYNAEYKEPWVSTTDIAAVVAGEFDTAFDGIKIRYVASDELTSNAVATILGTAIGKPDLKWLRIPDEQLLNGMLAAGMNSRIAKGLVEMNAARQSGELFEDYYRNKPALGKVKLVDFAKDFALAYNQ